MLKRLPEIIVRIRLFILICVFLSAASTIAGGAEYASVPVLGKVLQADTLQYKLDKNGEVRVLVKIAVPDYDSLRSASAVYKVSAPGLQTDASGMALADAALSREIADSADAVHAGLSTGTALREHVYNYLPYAVYAVDAAGLADLLAQPGVLTVQEDAAFPLPEIQKTTSADSSVVQANLTLVGADVLWQRGLTGEGYYVAVLDTGIRPSHAYFSGKDIVEACFTTELTAGGQLCPNGTTEQIGPGSAAHFYKFKDVLKGWDHGTHVSGIAAGDLPDKSLRGVAPDADIIAVQVFSETDSGLVAENSDVIKGLEYVYSLRGAHAIASVNLSLGGGSYSAPCDSDARKAGIDLLRSVNIATVIATGNNTYCSALNAPACISSSVAIGASDNNGTLAAFSNWDNAMGSLIAPGVQIYSSVADSDTSFGFSNGTSQATPQVAGAWVLLRQYNNVMSVGAVEKALQDTARDVGLGHCSPFEKTRRLIQMEQVPQLDGPGPRVAMVSVSDVAASTATIQASVRADFGSTVTERGICYGTGTMPRETCVAAESTGTGAFSVALEGLSGETTYYAAAYAKNGAGTNYSASLMFTTFSSRIGALKWKTTFEAQLSTIPAVGPEGNVYVGANDSYLYAFDASGKFKWRFNTGASVFASPSVAADGTVYCGSYTSLYALRPDGTVRWSHPVGGALSSTSLAADGTIFVGSSEGYVYALNPGGSLKWRYKASDGVTCAVAVAEDGGVYAATKDGYLNALTADGSLAWRYKVTDSYILAPPVIAGDGTIYIGEYEGNLYALNPDGTLKWSYAAGYSFVGSPVVGEGGTVFLSCMDSRVYMFAPDGSPIGSGFLDLEPASIPILGNDGLIYLIDFSGDITAANIDGLIVWRYEDAHRPLSNIVMGRDGTLYAGDSGKSVLALNTASAGPSQDAPWPMYGRDMTHSHRAGAGPSWAEVSVGPLWLLPLFFGFLFWFGIRIRKRA